MATVSYLGSTFSKAPITPRLADFCTAPWSDFAPPLTGLGEIAAQLGSSGLATGNPRSVAIQAVELDPAIVHAGGLEDRIEVDPADIDRLAGSIRTAGQKAPILVRPHPDLPDQYQIVAGRRRLSACTLAGLPVRAEIEGLDDRDLILGQAIENVTREILSSIECAHLATRMIDEAELHPADIDIALGSGKLDRSRYLKIGRGVPEDF